MFSFWKIILKLLNFFAFWRGFAVRGFDCGAQIVLPSPINIVESFNLPPNLLRPKRADFDGDGKGDFGFFGDGKWFLAKSGAPNFGFAVTNWGVSTDAPVPGDYDGDGRNDIAVYRDGTWYINQTTAGLLITQFGLAADVPIPNRYLP